MLRNLTIKNYAIIDNLSIEFDNGFNVFTGETGAGKSIIVGALSFLLKGRSDTSIIKTGKDKAIIEGVFSVSNKELINKLKQQDIDVDDEIIIKRTISIDNRNSIKINESNVTLNFLESLFENYVDIHSQKDNHYLYNKKNQLQLLDRFSNIENDLEFYKNEYQKYKLLLNEYDELINDSYNESEIEFIKFNYKELDDANISIDEESNLIELEKSYKSIEKYNEILNSIEELYDRDNGIKEKFYILKDIISLDDTKLNEFKVELNDIYYNLDDKLTAIKNILKSYTNNEYNLDDIENRLFTYSKLKRKYKLNTEELIKYKDSLKDKIQLFEDKDNVLIGKKKEIEKQFEICEQLAISISNKRKKASKSLISDVTTVAKQLMLNSISFDINFNKVELSANGIDDVDYLVSLNKGEPLRPLKNVASGGEVSRLMLALKVVFNKYSNNELLILDEIDTGVSGMAAHAVGKMISKLSKDTQVLCITHLAPVAAFSDSHYLIYKQEYDDSTTTNIELLDEDNRIKQLSIISNNSTESKAIEAAKELFINSQKEAHES